MVMKKGISPLIAAVILIAFVVAVASVVATFFTDIAVDWGEDIEGAAPVQCGMMRMEITDFSTELNEDNNATLSFRSIGSNMNGVTIDIYSDQVYAGSFQWDPEDEEGTGPFEDGPVEEGITVTVDLTDDVTDTDDVILGSDDVANLEEGDEVEIVSLDCTGITSEYIIEEDDLV